MKSLMKCCLAELVGVFTLCFIGAGAIIMNANGIDGTGPGLQIGLVGIALAHGLALAIAVSATMNISGGHINPAITIGLMVIGRCDAKRAACYIIAQLCGAALAGLSLKYLFPGALAQAVNWGTPALAGNVSVLKGVILEAIGTFLLAFAVYGTVAGKRIPQGLGGFAVGLAVCFLIIALGGLTGGAVNPARHFGTAIIAGITMLEQSWIYWIGPVIGAVIGFLLFSRILEKPENESDDAEA